MYLQEVWLGSNPLFDLPEVGNNLIGALATLDIDDFAHFFTVLKTQNALEKGILKGYPLLLSLLQETELITKSLFVSFGVLHGIFCHLCYITAGVHVYSILPILSGAE